MPMRERFLATIMILRMRAASNSNLTVTREARRVNGRSFRRKAGLRVYCNIISHDIFDV
jgi:hypothetical protein